MGKSAESAELLETKIKFWVRNTTNHSVNKHLVCFKDRFVNAGRAVLNEPNTRDRTNSLTLTLTLDKPERGSMFKILELSLT